MRDVTHAISGQRQLRRGAAVVEFAVLAPLLVLLLLGLWEGARLVEVQQILTSAAREGGALGRG